MNYLLLSHCFLLDKSHVNKIDIFNYSINYFKEKYKDIHIIVTGHGLREYSKFINGDTVIWHDHIESEYGQGHPKCVLLGLKEAKSIGAKKILKMRLDSISVKDDIFNFCDGVLKKENKKCLITAMTNLPGKWIGDLFMYGDINFLIDIWDEKKWDYNLRDGMVNLYSIYKEKYSNNIKDYFSFRSNDTLKWLFIDQNDFNNFKENYTEQYQNFLWDRYYGAPTSELAFYDNNYIT